MTVDETGVDETIVDELGINCMLAQICFVVFCSGVGSGGCVVRFDVHGE